MFTTVGVYKGNFVAVKELKTKRISFNRPLLVEFEKVKVECKRISVFLKLGGKNKGAKMLNH